VHRSSGERRSVGSEHASIDAVPLRTLTRLQENQDAFFVQSLRARSQGRARVLTVTWPKVSFDVWWSRARRKVPKQAPRFASYTLAPVVGGGCSYDTWTGLFSNDRASHTAVWTGSEMIVWGGGGTAGLLATGGRYTPATDSWAPTSMG